MIGVHNYAIWHHRDCIFKTDPKMARVSYTFVLMAPLVPIEQIEGTLNREKLFARNLQTFTEFQMNYK
jgi:hypothetical protein